MLSSLSVPRHHLFDEGKRRDSQTQGEVNKTFLSAVQNGNLDLVRLCLDNGADIKTRNKFGYSCLHFVARAGNLELMTFLVEESANVDATDYHLCTPLHWAVSNGHLAVIKYLIENSADDKAVDEDGHTLLHWASNKGHIEVVVFLIRVLGVHVDDLDKNGRTPLHYCSKSGHLTVLIFLLENGADTSIIDDIRHTAFHYSKSAKIREHLKAKDALNLRNYIEFIVCKDYRFGYHMTHESNTDDSFMKARNVNNAILMDALSSSAEENTATDLRARLIALHLAIEDRYPVLEREGDIEGFEMCMKYQDKIYLLVCPDDPEPNADIRRPLLTALTLAHYVDCEEYSELMSNIPNMDDVEVADSCREEKWTIAPVETGRTTSPGKIMTCFSALDGVLIARYNSLQKDRDMVGCGIILQYQDKIRLLASPSPS